MGPRGLLVFLLLIAAIAVVPLPARAVGPSITNVTWNPWVPAHLEDVTVEADIASPGGTPNVTASWCVLPPFTCIPFTMWDLDRDGHYNSTSIRVAGPPYTGAHFNVSAIDPGGNFSFTEEIYVQFASTIAIDATLAPASTPPGQLVSVGGTALYENNASVPARFCSVDFELVGTASRWSVTSDAAGAFASTFNAPGSIGNYTVRTTVSNRTIVGSEDRYLLVATEPTPDLAVVISSLIVSPSSITAGDTVTISVSVENGGTAAAGAFSVLINVSNPSGLAMSKPISVPGLQPGERAPLTATWTASEGSWTVTVLVDSGRQVSELSESNNRADVPLVVAAKQQGGPSATLIVGIAIVGVGVAAAAVLVYRRRAGRGKAP